MQQQLETTLAKLVSYPSESNNAAVCRQLIAFIRNELEPLGLYMTMDLNTPHPWLVATTQPTQKPKIMLVAHLDVVPADASRYELRIEGDRLYGRGAWDMKYAAAGYIEFLKAKRAQLQDYDIGVMFTTDEEIGGYQGVRKLLKAGWRTQLALIPDYGDDWAVEESAKGVHWITVSATGKSSHASRPWEGENAIQKLIPLLHELQTVYSSKDKLGPVLSVNVIKGGQAQNQTADTANAFLDFRSFEKQEITDFFLLLDQLTSRHRVTYEVTITGNPLKLNQNAPLVQQYLDTLHAQGIPPKFTKSFGGTDGRWFAEYDIPCIITGPHGEGAHGPDEWMRRSDLTTFYKILEYFLEHNAYLEAKIPQPAAIAEAVH